MRNGNRLGAVLVALSMIAAAALPAVAASGKVTVGSFIVELAKAKNLSATDAQGAAASLAALGIQLPANLDWNGRLTQGDVVAISRAAGLNVTTSDPTELFEQDQVDRFFLSFASELESGGSGISPRKHEPGHGGPGTVPAGFDPFTKGKQKDSPDGEPE